MVSCLCHTYQALAYLIYRKRRCGHKLDWHGSLIGNTCSPLNVRNDDLHCNYLGFYGSQFPPRSCLMKTTISGFSTVPDPSLSKVENTSSNASSENSSRSEISESILDELFSLFFIE